MLLFSICISSRSRAAKTLQPIISRKVKKGSVICSDTWKGYTGIAARGYVHRLVEHGKGEYSDRKGSLPQKVESEEGRLHLYLAEYVWRYNNRKLSNEQKVKRIIELLKKRRSV